MAATVSSADTTTTSQNGQASKSMIVLVKVHIAYWNSLRHSRSISHLFVASSMHACSLQVQ